MKIKHWIHCWKVGNEKMKNKKLMTILTTFYMALILHPATTFTYSECPPEPEPISKQYVEETVTEHTPFFTSGNGEVITDDSNKEYFTVTTANGNTYFLVIDRSQNAENVYILAMIGETDLQDFIE